MRVLSSWVCNLKGLTQRMVRARMWTLKQKLNVCSVIQIPARHTDTLIMHLELELMVLEELCQMSPQVPTCLSRQTNGNSAQFNS